MINVILCGIVAGILVKKTEYFFAVCTVIALLFGFSNATNFAKRWNYRDSVEQKNTNAAVLTAFVNGYIVAFIVALAFGGIAQLFL